MSTVREATARYVAARREYISAAKALRMAIHEEWRATVKAKDKSTAKKRTWDEAREFARTVQAFVADRPDMTQMQVGVELGISRDLVAYYTSNPKHARLVPTANQP